MRPWPSLPPLPFGIRVLRDAVIVMVSIATGSAVGALPYAPGAVDPRMVEVFQAVFGTLGFAFCAFHARSRRGLHVLLAATVVWLFAGLMVATSGRHPVWWLFALVAVALMALLGGGLARLVERLARA